MTLDRIERLLERIAVALERLAQADPPPIPGGPLRCWRCGENHSAPIPCIHRLGDR